MVSQHRHRLERPSANHSNNFIFQKPLKHESGAEGDGGVKETSGQSWPCVALSCGVQWATVHVCEHVFVH